ncbi:hypothetical protein DL762_009666 [Monosporascus cannonballus]|uniref:LPXTG-domain-containing protein n=1 Tax=Monosporascus cannonballus TaxID=155416 RepID=A0ABY0GWW1_9PEZI|nr:hypothetical protein DL762_009666 [Monosporascus cannonballus]
MAVVQFISFLTLLAWYTTALQVTPNSPCASFCVDSNDLDFSDPNFSNTKNKDITCYDSKYTTSPAGQKFQRCISCLQDSTFSQGSENDQLWFLYNLRYTFDYCIFGYPDAEDVASTPCSTQTACGELQTALTEDQLKGSKPDYSYCSAGGGAMAGPAVEKCLACVAVSDDQDYLANYFIALNAGCKQRPAAGTLVGLNETVFSKTKIGEIDPVNDAGDDDEAALPMGTMVGIAIGAVVVVLAIAGFLFVRCRKRRNIRLRLEGNRSSGMGPQLRNGPASPLSFRCQTSVSPRSPEFHRTVSETVAGEKGHQAAYGLHSLSPVSPMTSSPSMWRMQNPSSDAQPSHRRGNRDVALHGIATATTAPAFPGHVHYSTSPKAAHFFSPATVEDDVAPPSTVSTTSTAQLLPLVKPYNPADYAPGGNGASAISTPETTYVSPTSGSTASPLLSRAWEQHQHKTPVWDVPQRQQPQRAGAATRRPSLAGALGRVAGRTRRVSANGDGGNCSPVETTQINTVFAAPPTRR